MGVKCLAQEHNTVSPAWARTRTARSRDERTNHEATAPPFFLFLKKLVLKSRIDNISTLAIEKKQQPGEKGQQ